LDGHKITGRKLGDKTDANGVLCEATGHWELLTWYPIAQMALGHTVEGTCQCGATVKLARGAVIKVTPALKSKKTA
jgi:hypothetical protein